jgi:hypothetical protein
VIFEDKIETPILPHFSHHTKMATAFMAFSGFSEHRLGARPRSNITTTLASNVLSH